MSEQPSQYVRTDDAKGAVKGYELDVLDALGIDWPPSTRTSHTECPYLPEHHRGDPVGDWRWDEKQAKAFCTCSQGDSIFDVVAKTEGVDFDNAKLRVAEIIGRTDLIEANGRHYQRTDAASLLSPADDNRDDGLVRTYLASRLHTDPDKVVLPTTPIAGIKSLGYFDPAHPFGGKPEPIGEFPCAVFGTVNRDGRTHAMRIYLSADGAGKAPLGDNCDAKKSAKRIDASDNTAGRSVLWGDSARAKWTIVTEGIETGAAAAFAFQQEIGAGELLVAAAITAGGIESFQPWPGTELVTVAADRDEKSKKDGAAPSKRGERAARTFGLQHYAHLKVGIALPGEAGQKVDWLDILCEHGADAVRKGILAAQPFIPTEEETKEQAPQAKAADTLPYGYDMRATGLFWQDPNDPEKPAIMLSGPFQVLAETRDGDGASWGVLLEWCDRDERKHQRALPRAMLAGDGVEARRVLLDNGLALGTGRTAREKLTAFLAQVKSENRCLATNRVGWHGSSFVLPNRSLGTREGERPILQTEAVIEHHYRERGTLEEWRQKVARCAVGNSRLVVAMSAAFAAPLLDPCEVEGGGINFIGPSSIGKTTALVLAGSAWGGGGTRGYVRSWRSTSNGTESTALVHCDTLLCLDELGQADPRDVGASIYMLSNGQGKTRSARDGSARRVATWRSLYLSSGEIRLADKVSEDGRRRRPTAGQEVRIADLPADAGAGHGLFENLHGFANGEALADHLVAAARSCYGTAAPAFVEQIASDLEGARKAVAVYLAEFSKIVVPAGADGQVARVARRFGLIAAAGELATAMSILPWPEGEAMRGVVKCFKTWLAARGGVEPAEVRDGIEQVRSFLAANGMSRFDPVWETDTDGKNVPVRDCAGFRRRVDNGWDFYVTPSAWKEEVCRGFNPKSVANALAEKGLLSVPETGEHRAKREKPPGRARQRLYHVLASIVEGSDHE